MITAKLERGMATAEVCRRHGMSSITFHKWKAKFGALVTARKSQSENTGLADKLLTSRYLW